MAPPKKNPQDRASARIELRFTEAQKNELVKRAAKANLNLTDYLRYVLFPAK